MNTKTTILIKTDKAIKAKAQKAADAIGIPLSTILSAYLRKFASEERITFSVPLKPNAKLRASIAAAEKDKKGQYVGPFSSIDEMMEALNS